MSVLKKKTKKIQIARSILEEKNTCNKQLLAQVLHISRPLLYYSSTLAKKDLILKDNLCAIHEKHPWYGHRRIAWALGCWFKKARRLMKKFTIFARMKKRKKFTKADDIGLAEMKIPNLTKDLVTIQPNRVWRTDFTHLNYRGVLFYLATIIDDFTKEILGYAIGRNHSQEFVLEALKDAIRKTNTVAHILHSDQGSEYRSFLFLEFLLRKNIRISMSTKSSPWQNGWQESYYGKFKLEMDDLNKYSTFEACIEAIHHHIYYYNHTRIHTKLRMPPVTFHEKYNLLLGGIRSKKSETKKLLCSPEVTEQKS